MLARFLSKLASFRGYDNPYYGLRIPREIGRFWQVLEFVSVLPIIWLRFLLPSALGYWVVCDRYIPDFITWVSLTTNDQNYLRSFEARFLLALSSKPGAKIYVTASPRELSERRKEEILGPAERQLRIYDKIASTLHADRIDTTHKTVDESLKEVLGLLVPNKA